MWFAARFFGPPLSPPNALLSSAIEQKTLTFGDGFGTQAVGFFLQGGDASTRIALITATGEELTDTPSLDQGRVTAYRGYVSSDPIVSVRVFNTPDPRFGTNFQFDNVSRGVIVALPEIPTGLLVAFSILAPISGCLRRISSSSAQ
jgi:hypothetical protein